MYAKVEGGIVTKLFRGKKDIRVDGYTNQWLAIGATDAELKALGVYLVVPAANTGNADEFYTKQSPTYQYNSGPDTVTEHIVETAKDLALAKTEQITKKNEEMFQLLLMTDWCFARKYENGTPLPGDTQTYRDAVRTVGVTKETEINACADLAALQTLLKGSTGDPPVPNATQWPDKNLYNLPR